MSLLQTMLTHLDSPECEPSEQAPQPIENDSSAPEPDILYPPIWIPHNSSGPSRPPATWNTMAKSIDVSSRSISHGSGHACWQPSPHSKPVSFPNQHGKA